MSYSLPIAVVVALVSSSSWADACNRFPRIFHGWTMERYYDERGQALLVAEEREGRA